ncbi:hypothetical protein D6D19_02141 [Aureobasidium pullulans]|uniref:NADH dehydrogenase [ubiquinone] 1 alpha subcomplex subunit n=1 Tax=Aureobasidium pullulans TaxID=5580 RepID=A0A4S9ADV9_AURPU|nr:hypothetical protein D6D19_02141 [Aureobasidium pullulans]
MGDTKAGTLVGKDRYGNKYFENLEDLPLIRSSPAGMRRHQDVASRDSLTRPRHAWMSYMVDKPPSQDPLLQRQVRPWEPAEHRPCLTWSRSAYRPFSTKIEKLSPNSVKNKYQPWTPVAAPRK